MIAGLGRHYMALGAPTQNAFARNFSDRLCDERLGETLDTSLTAAAPRSSGRQDYNVDVPFCLGLVQAGFLRCSHEAEAASTQPRLSH